MDLIVVGTGISALLLAQSLIRRGCFRTLRVIGPAPTARAHRLSYWSAGPTPFDQHVDASWSRLYVNDRAASVVPVQLARLRYQSFRAQRWVEDTARAVFSAPDVEFIEANVEAIHDQDGAATVQTAHSTLRADSRSARAYGHARRAPAARG